MTAASGTRLLQLHLDLRWRSPRRKSSISRQRKERTDMLANISLDGGLLRGKKKSGISRKNLRKRESPQTNRPSSTTLKLCDYLPLSPNLPKWNAGLSQVTSQHIVSRLLRQLCELKCSNSSPNQTHACS